MGNHMSSEFIQRQGAEAHYGRELQALIESTRAQTINLDSKEGMQRFRKSVMILKGEDPLTGFAEMAAVAPQVSTQDATKLRKAKDFMVRSSLTALWRLTRDGKISSQEAERLRMGMVLSSRGIDFRAQDEVGVWKRSVRTINEPAGDVSENQGTNTSVTSPEPAARVHKTERLSKKSQLRRMGVIFAAGLALAACANVTPTPSQTQEALPTTITNPTQAPAETSTPVVNVTETVEALPQANEIPISGETLPQGTEGKNNQLFSLEGDKVLFSVNADNNLSVYVFNGNTWIPLRGEHDPETGVIVWYAGEGSENPVIQVTAPTESGGTTFVIYKALPGSPNAEKGELVFTAESETNLAKFANLTPSKEDSKVTSPEEVQEMGLNMGCADYRGCIRDEVNSSENVEIEGLVTGNIIETRIKDTNGNEIGTATLIEMVSRTRDTKNSGGEITQKGKVFVYYVPGQLELDAEPGVNQFKIQVLIEHSWDEEAYLKYDKNPTILSKDELRELFKKGEQRTIGIPRNGKIAQYLPQQTEFSDPNFEAKLKQFLQSLGEENQFSNTERMVVFGTSFGTPPRIEMTP